MNRWGRAGTRLTDAEIADRTRTARARRNQSELARAADNRIAYQLWRAGELKPHKITTVLDANDLHGPDVDTACGATEPDVDLWEAGKRYPTWQQVLKLAELCGVTPRFLCTPERHQVPVEATSLRFHLPPDPPGPPPVWSYPRAVVAATVTGAPTEMPEEQQ